MFIIPAIDIKGGECVRLFKGDYSTAQKVADNAVKTALSFKSAGAKRLHVVDLDGAKSSKPENSDLIFKIFKNSGLKIEVGGGIRNMATIDYYLQSGISRVILGTAAVNNSEFVKEAVKKYGEKIAVGIDAKNGFVEQNGWTEATNVNYLEMAEKMESIGVKYIIFTDISRDGTQTGPNLDMLDKINRDVSCNIIASGGIADLKDIANLQDLGLYGAIIGKALYSGMLSLSDAVKLCQN